MKRILLFVSISALFAAFHLGGAAAAQPSDLLAATPLDAVALRTASLASAATGPTQHAALKEDSGTERSFSAQWQRNDIAAAVLRAHPDQYPLWVEAVVCEMVTLPAASYPGAQGEVTLQAHIYSMEIAAEGLVPGALLGSSQEQVADVAGADGMGWFTHTLDAPILLDGHQSFLAAIEFKSGEEGETPSLVADSRFDVADDEAFFKRGAGWAPQSEAWVDPPNTGLVMIRALVQPAGGPTYYETTRLAATEDTMLLQGQPSVGMPDLSYLLVGDYTMGTFGAVRALVGFQALEPPAPEATVVKATLMLSNDRSITETVDGEITVYPAARAWDEASADWSSDADNFGEALDTRVIIGRERKDEPNAPEQKRNGWLTFDITTQARAWRSDPESNHGVMLRGAEGTLNSGRYLRSSEYAVQPTYRPQMVVEWAWPDPDFRTYAHIPIIQR